ncbi:DnaJ domain-containing protein [Sneathiella chinensis]|uniref:Molecular chaperone DnaJ n=1 Tax=Sneathiella chinensis TaxID=349750 RepID=A0ABQ5U7Q3_9PROT|nr:DnaJ domain-containing protein [Sneathiella chinensis]GLQ07708.1 molecular chaperone DnaJ [Sneathiella chinensis]
MLAYFIIGISLLVALIVGGQALANANPRTLIKAFRISGAIVLGGLAAFFAYTGRFQFAPPLAIAAFFLLRNRPLFRPSRPSPGQQSDVKTEWLHAILDHDSGDMDAEVLQGSFEGRRLSDLSQAELAALEAELSADAQSVAILNTYRDRRFGQDTEQDDHRDQQEQGNSQNGRQQYKGNGHARPNGSEMSRTEALEILELKSGASQSDIRAAHRRLMKKFHPDRGGSAYMAAKINQAKDVLINS